MFKIKLDIYISNQPALLIVIKTLQKFVFFPGNYCGAYIKSTSSGGGKAPKICAQFKRNVKIQAGFEAKDEPII